MNDLKIEKVINRQEEIEIGFDLAIINPGSCKVLAALDPWETQASYSTFQQDCDLGLSAHTDSSELQLKRAIQSPFGYIARYVIDADGLNKIDSDHGNRIYEELSEGMTINTITRIKEHINQAILYAPEIAVSDLEINLPDLDRLEIGLHYTLNNEYKYITADLPL